MKHQTTANAFDEINEIVLSIAESKRVPIVNVSEEMTGKVEFFSDHIHLFDKGSDRLAELMATQLEVLLKLQQKED